MSGDQSEHHTKNEIIIVKRRSDADEDGHHGGVWKIAYADFMTAMMAFFLVMWLVNAANDQTRAAVASYFNPIELVDSHPTEKGIKDDGRKPQHDGKEEKTEAKGSDVASGEGGDTGHQVKATTGEKTQYADADYFENPYAVLSEIARQSGVKANLSDAGLGGAKTAGPATGASGGTAYRDPFDPDFWVQQVQTVSGERPPKNDVASPLPGSAASGDAPKPLKQAKAAPAPAGKATGEGKVAAPEKPAPTPKAVAAETDKAAPENAAAAAKAEKAEIAGGKAPAKAEETAKAETAEEARKPEAVRVAKAEAPSAAPQAAAAAEKLKREIDKAAGGTIGKLAEGISVKAAEGGLLVSITDRADDGMFNVGSAVPRHDLVVAMQKIGEILASRGGPVVIRGYTDARPFKGNGYDNWRLSMARAESAYYMLVRGGLDKDRVMQISGFGDRHLLLPDQPYAAANRRIEILVKGKEAGR